MYNTFNGYMQGMQPYGNPYADSERHPPQRLRM